VYASVAAALGTGKHLLLIGTPGSGKTALALAIAEAAVRQNRCKSIHFLPAVAGAGGEAVRTAIEEEKWLVIDELDRVNLDDALGGVSTVLGGSPVDLVGGGELKPPSGWRMIATMADIDQVGETTPALRRRFVFVEVPVLERPDLETLVGAWAGDDEVAAAVGRRLVAIQDVVDLGPGLYHDAVSYVKARRTLTDAGEDDLTLEALAGFVLPQLEGGDDEIAGKAVRAAGFEG
jgi:MoxR-like ATPase